MADRLSSAQLERLGKRLIAAERPTEADLGLLHELLLSRSEQLERSIARVHDALGLSPSSRVKNTGTVTLDNPDRTIPYTDQVTAGYERQLWTTLSISADYVHARARDQLMLQDLNPGLRTSTARTSPLVRFDPNYVGAVNQPVNVGEIDYDALEVALVKRFGEAAS